MVPQADIRLAAQVVPIDGLDNEVQRVLGLQDQSSFLSALFAEVHPRVDRSTRADVKRLFPSCSVVDRHFDPGPCQPVIVADRAAEGNRHVGGDGGPDACEQGVDDGRLVGDRGDENPIRTFRRDAVGIRQRNVQPQILRQRGKRISERSPGRGVENPGRHLSRLRVGNPHVLQLLVGFGSQHDRRALRQLGSCRQRYGPGQPRGERFVDHISRKNALQRATDDGRPIHDFDRMLGQPVVESDDVETDVGQNILQGFGIVLVGLTAVADAADACHPHFSSVAIQRAIGDRAGVGDLPPRRPRARASGRTIRARPSRADCETVSRRS